MFYVGDRVICINNTFDKKGTWVDDFPQFKKLLKLGRIYTIRGINKDNKFNNVFIYLEEIICPPSQRDNKECGWADYRFKKIDNDNSKLHEHEKEKKNNEIKIHS